MSSEVRSTHFDLAAVGESATDHLPVSVACPARSWGAPESIGDRASIRAPGRELRGYTVCPPFHWAPACVRMSVASGSYSLIFIWPKSLGFFTHSLAEWKEEKLRLDKLDSHPGSITYRGSQSSVSAFSLSLIAFI